MSALKWVYLRLACTCTGNLPVRLATQRKSLRKSNLPLLATTCESVWPRLNQSNEYSGFFCSTNHRQELNKSWFELRALIFPRMTQLIELNVSSDWFTAYLRWLWSAKCGYLVSVSLPTLKIKTLWKSHITLQYHSTQQCSKYLIHHGRQWRKWTSHEPLHRCIFFWLASELSFATLRICKKLWSDSQIFHHNDFEKLWCNLSWIMNFTDPFW